MMTTKERPTRVSEWNLTASRVVARKRHWCEDNVPSRCYGREIRPGDAYVRAVAFPGHDGNTDGTGPSVMCMCLGCAAYYPALEPIVWGSR